LTESHTKSRSGTECKGLFLSLRAAVAWSCALGSLCFSIGLTQAFAKPQQKATPAALQSKASPPAKSDADSAEFKKLAARAKEARDQNRLQEAVELYEKALRLNPRWEEGWWDVGRLDYEADNYGDGVKAFGNVVELDPKFGSAWAFLGLCEFETRDYGNAFVHLQMAKSKGLGSNDELWNVLEYHLALLHILHGEFETANKLLTELLHQNVLAADVKMAIGLTLLRVPVLPDQIDPEKDALVTAAGRTGELIALSDFDEAHKSFEQLVHDYPATPFVHYAYALMLAGLSEYEKAEEELLEEIKINPESAMPYTLLAYVNVRLNRFQDALPLAQEAVKLAPQSFVAHYLLGRALLASDKVIDAVDEFSAAKRLAPDSPDVRYNLAVALARAKRPREAAAEQAEFRRLSALAQRERSRGASDVKNPSGNSSAPGEIELNQLQSAPAPVPHQ